MKPTENKRNNESMETSKGEFIFDFNCDDLPEDPQYIESINRMKRTKEGRRELRNIVMWDGYPIELAIYHHPHSPKDPIVYVVRYSKKFYLCEKTSHSEISPHNSDYLVYFSPIRKSDFKQLLSGKLAIGDIFSRKLFVTNRFSDWSGFKSVHSAIKSNELYTTSWIEWNETTRKAAEELLENWNTRRMEPDPIP